MATVTPLTQPEGSTPSDIQIEMQNLIEGRRKLQHLIAELNRQRAEAELAFLRDFSRDLAGLKVEFDRSFVDGVFNRYTSVKHAEEQTKQRITALGEIANKIGKRINHFKQSNPEDLIPILKRDLDKLMLARRTTRLTDSRRRSSSWKRHSKIRRCNIRLKQHPSGQRGGITSDNNQSSRDYNVLHPHWR